MNVLDSKVIKDFIKTADNGWKQGWHETNGGNMSYRLVDEEINDIKENFDESGVWNKMDVKVPEFANMYFIITGSGKFFQNIKDEPEDSICIVRLNENGDMYKIVWGLINGGRPTGELESHILSHSIKTRTTGGKHRVVYHSHPIYTNVLTFLLPINSEVFTRELWEMVTECSIIFPNGVGVIPWMVPYGADIGKATCEMMEKHDAVVWAHHGLLCSGSTLDEAFGIMHTIEKAATMLVNVLQAGGKRQTMSADNIRAIAEKFELDLDERYLYEK